jgi:hypothetical protein
MDGTFLISVVVFVDRVIIYSSNVAGTFFRHFLVEAIKRNIFCMFCCTYIENRWIFNVLF